MPPPEIGESLAARAVASLLAAKTLGECVDHYFCLLEGKRLSLVELSHLSAILGATMSRLRVETVHKNNGHLWTSLLLLTA